MLFKMKNWTHKSYFIVSGSIRCQKNDKTEEKSQENNKIPFKRIVDLIEKNTNR